MNKSNRFPILIPIIALVFVVTHLTFEHFTGGVKSHHLFNQADLPAISNWFGLITLPFLSLVFARRVRNQYAKKRWIGVPVPMFFAFLISFFYGAILALSFSLGSTNITSIAFLGLFVCGFVFPVYRIEYILGFVSGMTAVIGSVLPLLFALVVAVVSFIVRYVFSKIIGIFNKKQVR